MQFLSKQSEISNLSYDQLVFVIHWFLALSKWQAVYQICNYFDFILDWRSNRHLELLNYILIEISCPEQRLHLQTNGSSSVLTVMSFIFQTTYAPFSFLQILNKLRPSLKCRYQGPLHLAGTFC